jgi:hypothetical protein
LSIAATSLIFVEGTSLKMLRYTHVRLNDERAALEMLPDLTTRPSDEQTRATGTDDGVVSDQQGYPARRIHAPENGALYGALYGALCGTNPEFSAQLGANKNRPGDSANAVLTRGRRVSNPQPSDRQSDALTN